MAQYGRPISDITTGWATTPLWSKIDEVTPLDADWITGTGATVTFEVLLSTVTDPADNTNHVWSLRFQAGGSGGPERVNAYLYQGTTLIEQVLANVSVVRNSFNLHSGTILEANAANITDYSNLRIRVTTGNNGASETIDCSWAELSIPDAASIPVDETASLAIFKGVSSPVTYAGAPVSLSLAKFAGQSAAELGNVQETAALNRVNTVVPSTLISGEEVVNLNRVGTIAPSAFGIFDQSASMARSIGLTVLEDFTSTIQEAVSLSRLLAAAAESQEVSIEEVNLAKVAAVSTASQLVAYSATSLNRINTIPANTLGTLYELVNLAHLDGLSVLEETQGQTNESVILTRLMSMISDSQEQSNESISLTRLMSAIPSSQGIVGELVNLSNLRGLIVLEETQGQINESVILTRLMDITAYSQVIGNEITNLSSVYGLSGAAQSISDEAISLSSFYGLSMVELSVIFELVSIMKTNSVSLVDNATLFDNISLLKVDAISAEGPPVYIFTNGNNAFGVTFRDKRFRVVFRDKRGGL